MKSNADETLITLTQNNKANDTNNNKNSSTNQKITLKSKMKLYP